MEARELILDARTPQPAAAAAAANAVPTLDTPRRDAATVAPSSPPAAAAATATASYWAPAAGVQQQCYAAPGVEYDGGVAIWGATNVKASATECCESCRAHRDAHGATDGCLVWVFCAKPAGCATQKYGECWGKTGSTAALPPLRGSSDWTSGAILTPSEASALRAIEEAAAAARRERVERAGNPRVYFDVAIDGMPTGRMEFVLYARESPRHAENFRAMCTGERGGKLTFTGMSFYRIVDQFIDQAGVHATSSIWGGSFDDDPGGLKLKHEKPGLLSAANSGPDSNTGHFSIVVAPAPHLDGSYTVFGELVQGADVMYEINRQAVKGRDRPYAKVVVQEAGCLSTCEPRPDVGPKCKTRAEVETMVQQRRMKPCLD